MEKFTNTFDKYACFGDSIECESEGFTITAYIAPDEDTRIDDDDNHNPDQSVTGCNTEQQKRLIEAREAWLNDDWHYCGIVLSVSRNGIVLNDSAASLWGIEVNYPGSDNAYLAEVANELLSEALEQAKSTLEQLCGPIEYCEPCDMDHETATDCPLHHDHDPSPDTQEEVTRIGGWG